MAGCIGARLAFTLGMTVAVLQQVPHASAIRDAYDVANILATSNNELVQMSQDEQKTDMQWDWSNNPPEEITDKETLQEFIDFPNPMRPSDKWELNFLELPDGLDSPDIETNRLEGADLNEFFVPGDKKRRLMRCLSGMLDFVSVTDPIKLKWKERRSSSEPPPDRSDSIDQEKTGRPRSSSGGKEIKDYPRGRLPENRKAVRKDRRDRFRERRSQSPQEHEEKSLFRPLSKEPDQDVWHFLYESEWEDSEPEEASGSPSSGDRSRSRDRLSPPTSRSASQSPSSLNRQRSRSSSPDPVGAEECKAWIQTAKDKPREEWTLKDRTMLFAILAMKHTRKQAKKKEDLRTEVSNGGTIVRKMSPKRLKRLPEWVKKDEEKTEFTTSKDWRDWIQLDNPLRPSESLQVVSIEFPEMAGAPRRLGEKELRELYKNMYTFQRKLQDLKSTLLRMAKFAEEGHIKVEWKKVQGLDSRDMVSATGIGGLLHAYATHGPVHMAGRVEARSHVHIRALSNEKYLARADLTPGCAKAKCTKGSPTEDDYWLTQWNKNGKPEVLLKNPTAIEGGVDMYLSVDKSGKVRMMKEGKQTNPRALAGLEEFFFEVVLVSNPIKVEMPEEGWPLQPAGIMSGSQFVLKKDDYVLEVGDDGTLKASTMSETSAVKALIEVDRELKEANLPDLPEAVGSLRHLSGMFFPELSEIVFDDEMFAEVVTLLVGMTPTQSALPDLSKTDFSEIGVPVDIAEKIKAAASSMLTEEKRVLGALDKKQLLTLAKQIVKIVTTTRRRASTEELVKANSKHQIFILEFSDRHPPVAEKFDMSVEDQAWAYTRGLEHGLVERGPLAGFLGKPENVVYAKFERSECFAEKTDHVDGRGEPKLEAIVPYTAGNETETASACRGWFDISEDDCWEMCENNKVPKIADGQPKPKPGEPSESSSGDPDALCPGLEGRTCAAAFYKKGMPSTSDDHEKFGRCHLYSECPVKKSPRSDASRSIVLEKGTRLCLVFSEMWAQEWFHQHPMAQASAASVPEAWTSDPTTYATGEYFITAYRGLLRDHINILGLEPGALDRLTDTWGHVLVTNQNAIKVFRPMFEEKLVFDNRQRLLTKLPDLMYQLGYAVLLLSTDLHKPQVRNKITKDEFAKRADGNIKKSVLNALYDLIQKEPL